MNLTLFASDYHARPYHRRHYVVSDCHCRMLMLVKYQAEVAGLASPCNDDLRVFVVHSNKFLAIGAILMPSER
jgi:hypothetical protein